MSATNQNGGAHAALPSTPSAAQRRVIEFNDGVALVDAGPGSGKTSVISKRVARLTRAGVSPSSILCLTFSNSAKAEMRDRIKLEAGVQVVVENYHTLSHRTLSECSRVTPFRLLDEAAQWAAFLNAGRIVGETNHAVIRRVRNAVTYAKNHGQATVAEFDPPDYLAPQLVRRTQEIWYEYEQWCRRGDELPGTKQPAEHRRWLDFDDLLVEAAGLLRSDSAVRQDLHNTLRHIMVDEFQDSNLVQYQLLRMILEDRPSIGQGERCPITGWSNRSLMVVGDLDQSIYRFRGAVPQLVLGLTRDYPNATVLPLSENYRSSGNIVRAATSVIINNRERTQKQLLATRPAGTVVRLTGLRDVDEEAQLLAQRCKALWTKHSGNLSIAVLTRHNALHTNLQHALRQAGVISVRDGGVSLGRAQEIGYMVDLLTLGRNVHEDSAVRGVLAGVARHALTSAAHVAQAASISLWEALAQSRDEEVLRLRATVGRIHDALRAGRPAHAFALAFNHTRWAEKLLADAAPGAQEKLRALTLALNRFDVHEAAGADQSLNDLYSVFSETGHPVRLLTAHSAKALEWDYVFIAGADEDRWPIAGDMDLEEERRLFYVAMTRARKGLFISFLKDRPLEFVAEIPEPYSDYEEACD